MRINNNQQNTAFKQNIIMQLHKGMGTGSRDIPRIAELTGRIAENCAELVIPLEKKGFVLVSDKVTISGQLLSTIHNFVGRLVTRLGEQHTVAREAKKMFKTYCEVFKKEVLSAKAVFDSAGNPVQF